MAKGRASFLKRERERQRTERAADKRQRRASREPGEGEGARVATREDLDGYGLERDTPEGSTTSSAAPTSRARAQG